MSDRDHNPAGHGGTFHLDTGPDGQVTRLEVNPAPARRIHVYDTAELEEIRAAVTTWEATTSSTPGDPTFDLAMYAAEILPGLCDRVEALENELAAALALASKFTVTRATLHGGPYAVQATSFAAPVVQGWGPPIWIVIDREGYLTPQTLAPTPETVPPGAVTDGAYRLWEQRRGEAHYRWEQLNA